MDIVVQKHYCGTIEPGVPWTKGPDDVEDFIADDGTTKQRPVPRTMWLAKPSDKRKSELALYTLGAAEFYVAACAGYLIGGV
jgi:hypothetical protein